MPCAAEHMSRINLVRRQEVSGAVVGCHREGLGRPCLPIQICGNANRRPYTVMKPVLIGLDLSRCGVLLL